LKDEVHDKAGVACAAMTGRSSLERIIVAEGLGVG
jgi:hypothetical protein